ncbi:hypothetical protein VSR68_11370 [Paraburkholderia phymatum]|uniref:hypothetical protein n=1 Tax=Paraburkholderia phymatum TaxID=148447 RepID=UPI003176D05C
MKATAQFIGKITGLVPPPHNAFPPEWYGYLRTFTTRLNEIASVNAAPVDAGVPKIKVPDVILTGAQLLEALEFIAPDRATDHEQLEATVAIQYGEGHGGKAHYVWCAEYPEEGSFVLDGSSAVAALSARASDAAQKKSPASEEYGAMNADELARAQSAENMVSELSADVYTHPASEPKAALTDEQRDAIYYAIALIKSVPGSNASYAEALCALLRESEQSNEREF